MESKADSWFLFAPRWDVLLALPEIVPVQSRKNHYKEGNPLWTVATCFTRSSKLFKPCD
jgi:hypothetical protein